MGSSALVLIVGIHCVRKLLELMCELQLFRSSLYGYSSIVLRLFLLSAFIVFVSKLLEQLRECELQLFR